VMPPYWLPALIGITPSELGRRIEPGALQSGSANRWLYLAVRKRDITSDDSKPVFAPQRRAQLTEARARIQRQRNPLAVEFEVSRLLSEYAEFCLEQSVGVAQDLTRRLHVIALRIALIHAVAEQDSAVRMEHVRRALAVTEYGRRSLPWVFRSTLGDPIAELIYRNLLEHGPLSARAISRDICRDPKKRTDAIDELTRLRLVERQMVRTRGRSISTLVARREVVQWVDFDVDGYGRKVDGSPSDPYVQGSPNGHTEINDPIRAHQSGTEARESRTEGGQKPDVSRTEADPMAVQCHFYGDHQHEHRWNGQRFICPICDPEAA